jgi:tRNA (guanine9-N1)-methyltransferase
LQAFEGKLDELVYLTADSHNIVEALDPAKAYIVGGIVDRNRHKGICYEKATAQVDFPLKYP